MIDEISKSRKNSGIIIKIGVIALLTVIVVTCDPLFRFLFWLCDGEIGTFTMYCRQYCPYLVFGLALVFLVYHKFHINYGGLALILLTYSAALISSLINSVSLTRFVGTIFFPAVIYLLAIMFCQERQQASVYFRVMAYIFTFFAAVNVFFLAVAMPLYPSLYRITGEEWQETFLGYHNLCGFVLTTGMLYVLLDGYFSGRKWMIYLYGALYAANLYLCHSSTAIVGGFILLLYVFIPFVRKLMQKVRFWWILCFEIVFFVVLMFFFNAFINLAPVKFLVRTILHKDLTLTGRLYIWQEVLKEIFQRPILGYGMITSNFFFDSVRNHAYVHAHNQFLQSWHEGGILGILFPLASLFLTGFKVDKCKDKALSGIFKIVFLSLLTVLQTDQNVFYPWYVILNVINLAFLCVPLADKNAAAGDNSPDSALQSP